MCGKASGKLLIEFDEVKDFEIFGRNYAQCFLRMKAVASFDKPLVSGPLAYDVSFHSEVGCSTFLKTLKIEVDKQISNKKSDDWNASSFGSVADIPPVITPEYTLTIISFVPDTLGSALKPLVFAPSIKLSAPQALQATAVDSQLNYADLNVPKEMITANAYVNLYAQAAARAVLKSKGVDITKTDYLSTKDWYDQLTTQLIDLGFAAKSATTGGISQNTYSGSIDIGQILNSLLSAYFGPAEMAGYEALAQLMSNDSDDDGTKDFLTFWWSAASSDTKRTNLALGPLKVDQGQASVTLVYLSMDIAFQDWRSMFVSFHHEGVNIVSSAITLDLDMSVWESVSQNITDQIQSQITKHIASTTLNFG